MNVVGKLYEKVLLRAERKREYESLTLRSYFAKKYDINIGLYSYGCFDRWRIPPGTTIGRYCSFAQTFRVLDANHPITSLSTHPYLYDPTFGVVPESMVVSTRLVVEDDVWVGHNSIATPAVNEIGRGAIIGAGSVVTKNVPRYSIVAGNPARVLRSRFDDATIKRIEASGWWKLDKKDLARLVKEDHRFVFDIATARPKV